MPITFGSVGDIISVSLLVKDLVLALDKTRGASAAHAEVVRELLILDWTILEVEKLSRRCGNSASVEVLALYNTAQHTTEKCRITVDAFRGRIKKYDKSLGSGSGNVLKDIARKLQWQISENEVDRFRTEVMGHGSSLNILLTTTSVATSNINHNAQQQQAARTATSLNGTLQQQSNVLVKIQDQLHDNTRILRSFRVKERFDWICKMGSELKNVMLGVVAGNVEIFRELVSIRKMVATLGRTPSEDPVTLSDPLGRPATVHLKFINSWEAFHAVMEVRFKNSKGLSKIKNRQYVLEDRQTGRDIDMTEDIDLAVFPGQVVDRSLIFRRWCWGASQQRSLCPTCRKEHDRPLDVSIVCDGCGRKFRRIEVVDETSPSAPQKDSPVKFGVQSSVSGTVMGPLPMKRDYKPDALNEDLTNFKYIRLIVRRQRVQSSFSAPKHSQASKLSRKATANDAAKAGIPAGYSYKYWDPIEEPIFLLRSAFNANSLGKWIYD